MTFQLFICLSRHSVWETVYFPVGKGLAPKDVPPVGVTPRREMDPLYGYLGIPFTDSACSAS